MNYLALHDFLKDISQNLGLTTKWFHGRKDLLNQTDNNKPLYIFCLPFTSSGGLTQQVRQVNETWQVNLLFYMQDRSDSGMDQNDDEKIQDEIRILSITENAASKFIHLLNENQINTDLSDAADSLTVVSFSKRPAIKDTSYLLTGMMVTINILVPDDFDYCFN